MTGRSRGLLGALALLALGDALGVAQSFLAGTARNATAVLMVVRADGTEARLQGRGALQVFEGDTLRVNGQGQALVETAEGAQIALNEGAAVRILSRWEKGKGVTRVLRLTRGQLWARAKDSPTALEIETPVGVLSARAAEVSVRFVSDNEVSAMVVQGTADFTTALGSCPVRAGTVSHSVRGKPCTNAVAADVRTPTGWSRALLSQ
jgi:hypothetical protein